MRKKDNQKYDRILDAAADLILSGSVGDVSTTKIAKKARISQSSIYDYFKNRDELLVTLYLRELRRLYQGDAGTDAAHLSNEAAMQVYTRHLFDYGMAHPESMTVIQKMKGDFPVDAEAAKKIQAIIKSNPAQQLLFAGIDDGTLRPVDISLLRNMVFSTIKLHTENLLKGVYTEADVPFEQVLKMITHGIMNDK